MRKAKYILLTLIVLIGTGSFFYHFYSYVFAKKVSGLVIAVERVNQNTSIITNGRDVPANQIFSFAVAIKTPGGEIVTGSSEDRQWAVVEKGQCAEAKFFPYPPWDLDKGDTYFGVRLLRLYACPK